jgi:hypothetical protein
VGILVAQTGEHFYAFCIIHLMELSLFSFLQ